VLPFSLCEHHVFMHRKVRIDVIIGIVVGWEGSTASVRRNLFPSTTFQTTGSYTTSLLLTIAHNHRRYLLGGHLKLMLIAMQRKSILRFTLVLDESPIDLALMCQSGWHTQSF
jgi:hypothetical protein